MGVHFKENEDKITLGMIIAGTVIIAVLVAILIIYFININATNKNQLNYEEDQIIGDLEENDDEYESVSIDIGKNVEEAKNELNTTTNTANTQLNSNQITNNTTNKTISNAKNTTTNETKANITDKKKEEPKEEKKEITFIEPIKGEIIREFAPDSLVYSETLQEWVIHNGVDIKADKTAVVKASADGKVTAIKNDPRYGITVIISHEDGYETVYANLLTAEYVIEGEEVLQGQTIGTIGNSANFEIADEPHLHFEMLKDGQYIKPTNF